MYCQKQKHKKMSPTCQQPVHNIFLAEATTTATFLWALPEQFHVASQNFT